MAHTGDLARVDEHGILSITGRLDDMMIVGGFNVMPAQIEDVLRSHPAVHDAVVVAVPDDRLGDLPVAGIVWAGTPIDDDALAAHCCVSIEAFKVPRRWFVLDEIPLTAAGKLDRRAAEGLASVRPVCSAVRPTDSKPLAARATVPPRADPTEDALHGQGRARAVRRRRGGDAQPS